MSRWRHSGEMPTTRLRQPDPADITGPIAFRQQSVAQRGEKRSSIVLRFLDRLSVHSRRPLVAYHLEQRLCQIGDRRHLFEQPTGVGRTGDGSCHSLALLPYAVERRARRMRPACLPPRPLAGCRRKQSSIDGDPSFSIHLSLCSTGFHRLPRSYEEIRLLHGRRPVVVASFRPTARTPSLTRDGVPFADPCRPPRVRTLDVLPLPAPIPLRSRLDFGRRVPWHAHPIGPACTGLHLRPVLQRASGFFPTRPHGDRLDRLATPHLRAVAFGLRLLPTCSAEDLHLQFRVHAWHTKTEPFGCLQQS
jgi:hypothetical protein